MTFESQIFNLVWVGVTVGLVLWVHLILSHKILGVQSRLTELEATCSHPRQCGPDSLDVMRTTLLKREREKLDSDKRRMGQKLESKNSRMRMAPIELVAERIARGDFERPPTED